MMCFYPEIGGVYKSTDNGLTWDYVGLQNHQVQAVEVNAEGDLFIGVYGNFIGGGGGIYAIYHDNPQIIECLYGPDVNGLAVNSAGDIYAGIGWPDGIIVSTDNGNTFEFNNSGLPQGPVGKLYCDHQDYIFALSPVSVNWMCKSIEPTVGIKEISVFANIHNIQIAPNPVQDIFQGRFNGSLPDGSYAYTISGLSGNNIVEGSLMLSQNSFSIDISFLPPGFYILKLNCNGITYTSKIIKI
ncbi:MAG: T9SS type A sorting domain-containing protein [Bacteroidales bacterium]|nr:T9SS type A sorting domain-containing protein [Bacteroidales bacterium]